VAPEHETADPGPSRRHGGPIGALLPELLRGGGAGVPGRIPTGIEPLDTLLSGGMRPGDLTVLGGRPGVGKTALALCVAANAAAAGVATTYACLEHDPSDLVERLLLGRVAHADAGRGDLPPAVQTRALVADALAGTRSWTEAVAEVPQLEPAHDWLAALGDRLTLVCGAHLDLDAIAGSMPNGGSRRLLVVDYLQKLTRDPTDVHAEEAARACKALALDSDAAVFAISATDHDGLRVPRVRLANLRGSATLAYESDLVLVLEDKMQAVSRRHTAFDGTKARQYRDRSVVVLEKHRRGIDGVAIELRRSLAHSWFDPAGSVVAEELAEPEPVAVD
jgi:replicative DNA helicase